MRTDLNSFFKKKEVRILALVLVVAVIIAVSASVLNGRAGIFANTSGALSAPVKQVTLAFVDWLEGIYGYLYKYDQLLAEVEALKEALVIAREEAMQGAIAVEENKRLMELTGLKEMHTDFDLTSARIIEWNSSNWASSFTIGKGESSGIKVGDCVITEYNALVGQVTEVGDGWANVRTVVDVEMSIGALVGEAGNAAMVVGDFSLMKKGNTKLTHLTEGAQPFVGDPILTSGKGGMFPPGLIIGYVNAIELEAAGQLIYAVVEPAYDLDTIAQVFVVREFDVIE